MAGVEGTESPPACREPSTPLENLSREVPYDDATRHPHLGQVALCLLASIYGSLCFINSFNVFSCFGVYSQHVSFINEEWSSDGGPTFKSYKF